MEEGPLRQLLDGIRAISDESPDDALAELDDIISQGIESVDVWMLKACIHFQRDDHSLAVESFSRVIKRKPKSEGASLGLFHSLWSSGNEDAAFEEMKRFFREVGLDNKSQTAQDYWAIVKEINEQ